jgi:hypothetical protein
MRKQKLERDDDAKKKSSRSEGDRPMSKEAMQLSLPGFEQAYGGWRAD